MRHRLLPLLLLALLVSACSAPTLQVVKETVIVEKEVTVIVEKMVTVVVKETIVLEIVVTATPWPTPTPEPGMPAHISDYIQAALAAQKPFLPALEAIAGLSEDARFDDTDWISSLFPHITALREIASDLAVLEPPEELAEYHKLIRSAYQKIEDTASRLEVGLAAGVPEEFIAALPGLDAGYEEATEAEKWLQDYLKQWE